MHCLFDFGCKIRLSSENNSPTVGKISLKTGKSKPNRAARLKNIDEMGDFSSTSGQILGHGVAVDAAKKWSVINLHMGTCGVGGQRVVEVAQ